MPATTLPFNPGKVEAYCEHLVKQQLISTFQRAKPLLCVMYGSLAKKSMLGDPTAAAIWGGAALPRGKVIEQVGSFNHRFRIQLDQPDEPTFVDIDGRTPTSSVFADDLVDLAETRWTDWWSAIKIRKDTLDDAKGNLAIASLMEEAIKMQIQPWLDNISRRLYTGTVSASDQTGKRLWSDFLGLQSVCSLTGTYACRDRTVYPVLKGRTNTAAEIASALGATYVSTTKPLLAMFRQIRITDKVGSTEISGMARKDPRAGRLAITTAELWGILAAEAEGKHTIFDSGAKIPELLGSVSTAFPVIRKDDTYITYDPDCPSGEIYILSPEYFLFEAQANNNFKQYEWRADWEAREDGFKFLWKKINAKLRWTCYRPDLQWRGTGFTTT